MELTLSPTSRRPRSLPLGTGDHRPHLPAGVIKADSPAGRYLPSTAWLARISTSMVSAPRQPRGHDPRHLRQHPPAQPGCSTASRAATPATSSPAESIFDASQAYQAAGIPLVVLGGKEYGSPHATGRPMALLGVKAVITSPSSASTAQIIGMRVLSSSRPARAESSAWTVPRPLHHGPDCAQRATPRTVASRRAEG